MSKQQKVAGVVLAVVFVIFAWWLVGGLGGDVVCDSRGRQTHYGPGAQYSDRYHAQLGCLYLP